MQKSQCWYKEKKQNGRALHLFYFHYFNEEKSMCIETPFGSTLQNAIVDFGKVISNDTVSCIFSKRPIKKGKIDQSRDHASRNRQNICIVRITVTNNLLQFWLHRLCCRYVEADGPSRERLMRWEIWSNSIYSPLNPEMSSLCCKVTTAERSRALPYVKILWWDRHGGQRAEFEFKKNIFCVHTKIGMMLKFSSILRFCVLHLTGDQVAELIYPEVPKEL